MRRYASKTSAHLASMNSGADLEKRVPEELHPLPPLPSLGLVRGRQGGVVMQEASALQGGLAHLTPI